jgi:hypothetical protein
MVRAADVDDLAKLEAAQADWRKPADRSTTAARHLIDSILEFVPTGFTQGIEILKDSTTPMKFAGSFRRCCSL